MRAARPIVLALAAFAAFSPAWAQEFTSQYSRLDHASDCRLISETGADGNTYSERICPGPHGLAYMLRSSDGRDSVTFNPGEQDRTPTFGRFNYANGVVEWRSSTSEPTRPLAAIQRWFLADIDGNWSTQILVVTKLDQPACTMGYVDASDGAAANVRAREIADQAENFSCSNDLPQAEPGIAEFIPPP